MSLTIQIATGVGKGPTTLAAFDAALRAAGTANYNLVRLSSVIPSGSSVLVTSPDRPLDAGGGWGDRLYAVWADKCAETPNEEAWAGLGWTLDTATGEGLFVEHWGTTEHEVRRDIEQSLFALAAGRGILIDDYDSAVVGAICDSEPVCALGIAAYAVMPWEPTTADSGSVELATSAVGG